MNKLKIKKGATVQVISGADKGKKGTVLEVKSSTTGSGTSLRLKVQDVCMRTHFDKKEGLLKKEGFLDYSNVKLLAAAEKSKKSVKKASKAKST